MNQVTLTFFFWRSWTRLFTFHFFHLKGMWALSLRVGPIGLELNNNAVWTLAELAKGTR